MGRDQIYANEKTNRLHAWQLTNDRVANQKDINPIFDAYSFYEIQPSANEVTLARRPRVNYSDKIIPSRLESKLNNLELGFISKGSQLELRDSHPSKQPFKAFYLNTGGAVGMMRGVDGSPQNITNKDGTGMYIDSNPDTQKISIHVTAKNTDDEIFTYGAGRITRNDSSLIYGFNVWNRDDRPRRVLSGAGKDFVMGGWGRDIIAPGYDSDLSPFASKLNGERTDYDKISPNSWLRALDIKKAPSFKVPHIGNMNQASIPTASALSKAYVGGSMQDILIGGPQGDVLIGDRIAGVEGGIGSKPDGIEQKVNDIIGYPLKTTSLPGRDLGKIQRNNILNDLYVLDAYDEKHNNWYPYSDFIVGSDGDDLIYGDDTEADPNRLTILKSLVKLGDERDEGDDPGRIRDRALQKNELGLNQIRYTDPLFKNRTWDGRVLNGSNSRVYKFGDDVLLGGDGDDRIFGGMGGDLIIGGNGVDLIDTGEAILANDYRGIYGADSVWGDLPGKLKTTDYPDIFVIGPLYLTEAEMKEASPNPDAKTIQEMQAEMDNATNEYNKNIKAYKTALGLSKDIAKAIPKVGPALGFLIKASSMLLSKKPSKQLRNEQISPDFPTAATVFVRDFDPLDIINIPTVEIFEDNQPTRQTGVRVKASAPNILATYTDPKAFKDPIIGQKPIVPRTSVEITVQTDPNKPEISRVVIQGQQWLTDWANEIFGNPNSLVDPITNDTIDKLIGYGIKRTLVPRDSNPDNPANKLAENQTYYNTVVTFAVPETLKQIAIANNPLSPETYWDNAQAPWIFA